MAATVETFNQLPAPVNFNARATDDLVIPLLIKDDGVLVDWADYTLTADLDGGEDFVITTGLDGEAFLTLTDEQTTIMGFGYNGKYNVILTRILDDYVRTILQGKLKLKA